MGNSIVGAWVNGSGNAFVFRDDKTADYLGQVHERSTWAFDGDQLEFGGYKAPVFVTPGTLVLYPNVQMKDASSPVRCEAKGKVETSVASPSSFHLSRGTWRTVLRDLEFIPRCDDWTTGTVIQREGKVEERGTFTYDGAKVQASFPEKNGTTFSLSFELVNEGDRTVLGYEGSVFRKLNER